MTIAADPRFVAGQVVCTIGVTVAFEDRRDELIYALRRHVSGDWGDLSDSDRQLNEDAIQYGSRILSAYELNPKIWIITEADRSSTTILLPEEY